MFLTLLSDFQRVVTLASWSVQVFPKRPHGARFTLQAVKKLDMSILWPGWTRSTSQFIVLLFHTVDMEDPEHWASCLIWVIIPDVILNVIIPDLVITDIEGDPKTCGSCWIMIPQSPSSPRCWHFNPDGWSWARDEQPDLARHYSQFC